MNATQITWFEKLIADLESRGEHKAAHYYRVRMPQAWQTKEAKAGRWP